MKTHIVNSFTTELLKGNPAAVCFPKRALETEEMQKIAKELNLSETAFVLPREQESSFSIRYFSPLQEIPLCGHATLASAHVLFSSTEQNRLEFITQEALLLITERTKDLIQMQFPAYETTPASVSADTLSALGIDEVLNCRWNEETKILLLEIEDGEALKQLKPKYEDLLKSREGLHGVVITAASTEEEYDFYSRFFWPWSGGNEDPVTGGTHTFLAPYWGQKLKKTHLRAYQASARSGEMEIELLNQESILIRAKAMSVLEGDFNYD